MTTDHSTIRDLLPDHPRLARGLKPCGQDGQCLATGGRTEGHDQVIRTPTADGGVRNVRLRRLVGERLGLVEQGDQGHVVRATCGTDRCVAEDHLYTTSKAELSFETVGYGNGMCRYSHPIRSSADYRIQYRADGRTTRTCRRCHEEYSSTRDLINTIMGA